VFLQVVRHQQQIQRLAVLREPDHCLPNPAVADDVKIIR